MPTSATRQLTPAAPTEGEDSEITLATNAIRAAFESVPEHKRGLLAARLTRMLARPRTPQRAGAVLDKVVQLFKERGQTEWSASEVQGALADTNPNQKAVYNALTYLSRVGVLHRVGYGKYLIDHGVLVVTSDELPSIDILRGGVLEE